MLWALRNVGIVVYNGRCTKKLAFLAAIFVPNRYELNGSEICASGGLNQLESGYLKANVCADRIVQVRCACLNHKGPALSAKDFYAA